MSSALINGLRRITCAVLCYGMVFSYPSWTIFGRVAHAAEASKPSEGVKVDDSLLEATPEPGTQPSKTKSEGRPSAPSAKASTKHTNASGSKPKREKKVSEPPVGGSCSEDKFYIGATSGGSMNLFTGDSVCTPGQKDGIIQPHCWTQFFIFLGAAEANASYVKGTPERSPAPGVAARTLSSVNEFVPKVGDELSKTGNEEALAKVLDKMSRPDLVKNQDNKQCCLQLVEQARKVATFIKSSNTNPARKDLSPSKTQQQKMDALIAQKQAQCESGTVIAGGGGHTSPAPAAAKKDNKGLMLGIFLALVIALAIWAYNSKKKNKDRPTETPPPICKGKKCGGGTTAEEPPPPCNTGNCGNNVGTTTAEEPPVTNGGNTYPETTGETTRGNTTGETGGDTYPNTNGDTTRGNSTGDGGTVTGSTTASSSSEAPSTTGSTTLDEPVDGGDGPGRTTSGTTRPLAPGRTLIKK